MNSISPQNSPTLQSHSLTFNDALSSDTESASSLPAAVSPRLAAAHPAASPRAPSSLAASEHDTLEAPTTVEQRARAGREWVVKFAPGTKTGSPAGSAALPQRAAELPVQAQPRTGLKNRTSPSRHPVSSSNDACMQWVSEGLRTHAGEAPYRAPLLPQPSRADWLKGWALAGTVVGAALGATVGFGMGATAAMAGFSLMGLITTVAGGLCIGALVGLTVGLIYGEADVRNLPGADPSQ